MIEFGNSHCKLCFESHLSILSDFLVTFRSLTFDRSRCLAYRKRKIESDDVMSEGAMTWHSEILTASSVFSFISQFFRISWLHFVR